MLKRYLLLALVIISNAHLTVSAAEHDKLPNIIILATGGTIAGTGESSSVTVGYTSATVGIETLIQAVPEMKNIANITGEQFIQIGSENINNEIWLNLAKRVNEQIGRASCRERV